MDRPLDKQTVDNICIANGLRNAKELGAASIRQFVSVVKDIEAKMGVEYIRMEIGEPGLPAEQIGIEAEHEALLAGVGSKYPLITGIEPLTKEASRFVKAFINLERLFLIQIQTSVFDAYERNTDTDFHCFVFCGVESKPCTYIVTAHFFEV